MLFRVGFNHAQEGYQEIDFLRPDAEFDAEPAVVPVV